MSENEIGFLYVASGKHFLEEAIISSRSLRIKCPLFPIAIATDELNSKKAGDHFDQVLIIDNPQYNFIDKIRPLAQSPFEKTLFLDTDTFIVEDISSLFELLDKYDFCAAFAPGREQMTIANLPSYFPEFNTGVIGYSNSMTCLSVLENWLSTYKNQLTSDLMPPHDQPAFRQALFQSEARVYCLSNEYNFRTTNSNIVWGNVTIKVIHGRHDDYEKLSSLLNKDRQPIRFFFQSIRYLPVAWLQFLELKHNKFLTVNLFRFIVKAMGKVEERLRRSKTRQKKKGN